MIKRIATIKPPIIKLILRSFTLAILPLFVFQFNNYGQIDPKKVDSLSRLIDSSAHAYKEQQESVVKYQDSTYKSEMNKAVRQNSPNPDNFLVEQKRREEKERRQTIIRIFSGVLLLLIAIIAMMRRKKSKP